MIPRSQVFIENTLFDSRACFSYEYIQVWGGVKLNQKLKWMILIGTPGIHRIRRLNLIKKLMPDLIGDGFVGECRKRFVDSLGGKDLFLFDHGVKSGDGHLSDGGVWLAGG